MHTLLDQGILFSQVIKKENMAEGLYRSKGADGYPLDIGGDHFSDT